MASRWISSLSEPYSSCVLLAHDRPGQLAGLAHRHERRPEVVGDGGGEDEAAGLDADDAVDLDVAEAVGELVDGPAEGAGVAEQRGDVPERDAGLGEVGDLADQRAQPGVVDHLRGARLASGVPVMDRGYRRTGGSRPSASGRHGGRRADRRTSPERPIGRAPRTSGASSCAGAAGASAGGRAGADATVGGRRGGGLGVGRASARRQPPGGAGADTCRTPPGPAMTTARRSSPTRWSPAPEWCPANSGERAFSHPSSGEATKIDE